MGLYERIAPFYDRIVKEYSGHEKAWDYDNSSNRLQRLIIGSTVLELGCGTGNLSIDLAKKGYTVTGIDSSEEMLEEARQKVVAGSSIEFYRQDARELYLPHVFDTVIIYESVFNLIRGQDGLLVETYLRDDQEITSAIRNVRDHLVDGGRLIIDIRNPRDPNMRLSIGEGLTYRVELEEPSSERLHITHLLEQGEQELVRESVDKYLIPLKKFEGILVASNFQVFGIDSEQEFFLAQAA